MLVLAGEMALNIHAEILIIMKKILFVTVLIICWGCHKNTPKNVEIVALPNFIQYHEDLYRKTDCGDTLAYEKFKEEYSKESYFPILLPICLKMADKYHYRHAYWDAYLCLWHAFNDDDKNVAIYDLTRFDPDSRQMAIYYLGEAAKRGNQQAKDILIKQYIR